MIEIDARDKILIAARKKEELQTVRTYGIFIKNTSRILGDQGGCCSSNAKNTAGRSSGRAARCAAPRSFRLCSSFFIARVSGLFNPRRTRFWRRRSEANSSLQARVDGFEAKKHSVFLCHRSIYALHSLVDIAAASASSINVVIVANILHTRTTWAFPSSPGPGGLPPGRS